MSLIGNVRYSGFGESGNIIREMRHSFELGRLGILRLAASRRMGIGDQIFASSVFVAYGGVCYDCAYRLRYKFRRAGIRGHVLLPNVHFCDLRSDIDYSANIVCNLQNIPESYTF